MQVEKPGSTYLLFLYSFATQAVRDTQKNISVKFVRMAGSLKILDIFA